MQPKDRIDGFGAVSLAGFALLLGTSHLTVKLINEGFQPVFWAGLRSAGAAICLYLWFWARGRPVRFERRVLFWGVLSGLLFAVDFLFIFVALDLTTVVRSSVIYYSMPIWLAIAAHFVLPGERLFPRRVLGLVLAFAGVAIAIATRDDSGQASLLGDLFALIGALGWAGLTLAMRITPLRDERPEVQLMWQVAVSVPAFLLAALFFGPLLREPTLWHVAGLAYHSVVIVAAGFVFWLWLLSIYPASGVASFSFLTPVFGVLLGWLVLDEPVGPPLFAAVALVAAGLVLTNLPRRHPARR